MAIFLGIIGLLALMIGAFHFIGAIVGTHFQLIESYVMLTGGLLLIGMAGVIDRLSRITKILENKQ